MDLPVLLAPLASFLVVVMFCGALYARLNQGGMLARRRVAVFAPNNPVKNLAAPLEGSALRQPKRYSSIGSLDRLLQRKSLGTRLSFELARAAMPLRVGEYILVRWSLGLLALLLVRGATGSLVLGIVLGVGAYFCPALYMRWKQMRRVREFEDQLVDALVLIANALRSGYSFLQGMEAVSQEMPAPIGAEFAEALQGVRMGGSVEAALMDASQRVGSADFELVVTGMVIQRQVGGNLTEILSNIANTVRERHRILREVRVLTAQERLSGYVVAGLPLALMGLLSIASPGYMSGMWNASSGRLILAAGFVMELIGLLVIRRIVDIEV